MEMEVEDVIVEAEEVDWRLLPEELLENIFGRLSPYEDLDNVKVVCRRWNQVAYDWIQRLQAGFENSLSNGELKCVTLSNQTRIVGKPVTPWISARFGHMCCYFDRAMYVLGGTAQASTTFNDMWKFDLTTREWSRCIASGQYPTPKALASFVRYKNNFILFGGWAHPPTPHLVQPWRIFDELHVFHVPTNKWTRVVTTRSPFPSAGHSATVHGDWMVVFGGRIFNSDEQSYPLSNSTWLLDFKTAEWFQVTTQNAPPPRYGQTQIAIDDSHLLVIGGCGGPNRIFSDAWLLKLETKGNRFLGTWQQMGTTSTSQQAPNDFHYSGCRVGSKVVFCERSSRSSPFLAFLHFDNCNPVGGHQMQPALPPNFALPSVMRHCQSSALRPVLHNSSMPLYSVDISKVLTEGLIDWQREADLKLQRPKERLLYSMIAGRAELIIFGGFYKERGGQDCRVSNDVFVLRTEPKIY